MTLPRTEELHPAALGMQDSPPEQALAILLAGQATAVEALRAVLPALGQASGFMADALRAGGRVVYAGAGSSGLMALADALELAGTFGIAVERTPVLFAGGVQALLHLTGGVEDDPAQAEADVTRTGIGARDVLVCVSASGRTPYTLEVARLAASRGARVIGLANVPGSPLLELADIAVLLDTGPEIVAGSTRMGAGTAQKIALNMLSTASALQLGHVHDGRMVNLVADNEKLLGRAARIVEGVAHVPQNAALAALSVSGGAVKPAVLIARGATPEQAEDLLGASDGHLGPALAALAAVEAG